MFSEQETNAAVRPPTSPSVRELALLAIGFGCLIGYTRMLSLGFVGYLSQGVFESSDLWYVLRSGISLATLAILACSGWFHWFKIGTKTLLLSTAGAVAAAIIFAIDENASFGWAVSIIGGLSSAILMYTWMLLLSRYDKLAIAKAAIVGLALSGAIVMGVPHLDAAIALIVAVGSAFMTGACALLLDASLDSCAPDGPLHASEASRVPWITVVMLLLSGFQATVLYGVAMHLTWLYDWQPNYAAFGIAIVAVLASTFALLLRSRQWPHMIWIPPFLLVVLALAFSCFSIRLSIQIAVGLLLAAVFCAHFLHWVIFPALFSTLKIPRAFLAGIVLICANGSLATIMGDWLGDLLPHSMQNLGGVAGIAIIVLALAFALTGIIYRRAFGPVGLFSQGMPPSVDGQMPKYPGSVEESKGAENPETTDSENDDVLPATQEPSPLDILQARIDTLAAEYGLTPREVEVAFLTSQGFSCGYIAEKLVVSESTVRFHQKNLYRKLDVHSRNELIELVNLPGE